MSSGRRALTVMRGILPTSAYFALTFALFLAVGCRLELRPRCATERRRGTCNHVVDAWHSVRQTKGAKTMTPPLGGSSGSPEPLKQA
jgi:hypothetical protein